ncbi:MAG: YggT family protein, partial [Anaerolineae bacterium]|nr:YggT family protein [Anaerolineae bacterium]
GEKAPEQTQESPTTSESEEARHTQAARARSRRQTLAKATQIIWLVTGILEALIGIRFILRLLAANPQAGFARFIYGITSVFLVPFLPLFEDPSANGWVLEVSSLVAMLVYALGAWGVVRVMWVTLEESPKHGGGPGAPA